MTTLITGATGNIGRLLVADLLERGADVRALTRDPGSAGLPASVDVVRGGLADAPAEAFRDVDAVFLFPAEHGVEAFVERAVAAGVPRFVVLSSLAVSGRNARDAGTATAVHHRAVEEAVTSRAAGWTILRPGNFANNLLFWASAIRSGTPVRMPYAGSSQVLVHEADVAAVAAIAVTAPGAAPSVVELTGPASLTKVEQLATIGEALGRELPHVEITPDEFRADTAPFMPPGIVEMLLRYWAETLHDPEPALPPALGRARTPLSRWALDHRGAFGG
jgi:uncharacterized protein YbjT (DUF2867 family)